MNKKRHFTIIELIAVVTIMGIISAIAFSAMRTDRTQISVGKFTQAISKARSFAAKNNTYVFLSFKIDGDNLIIDPNDGAVYDTDGLNNGANTTSKFLPGFAEEEIICAKLDFVDSSGNSMNFNNGLIKFSIGKGGFIIDTKPTNHFRAYNNLAVSYLDPASDGYYHLRIKGEQNYHHIYINKLTGKMKFEVTTAP